jgi:hypothetical protein
MNAQDGKAEAWLEAFTKQLRYELLTTAFHPRSHKLVQGEPSSRAVHHHSCS